MMVPTAPVLEEHPEADGASHEDRDGRPSVPETIATTVTGVLVGGAAVWFLAPICFVC